MWEQNETGLKREFSQDVWPTVEGWSGRLGDDPELAIRMINEGDGLASRGCDGPAATEEINLVVVVYPATAVEGQMEIEQAGVGPGLQDGALFALGFGA